MPPPTPATAAPPKRAAPPVSPPAPLPPDKAIAPPASPPTGTAPQPPSTPDRAPASLDAPRDGAPAAAPAALAPLFPLWAYIGTAIFGALLVLIVLIATLVRTTPYDETQQPVIRTALALGCACVAVLLPGAAHIKVTEAETEIGKAASEFSGPLALFFLVFWFYKPPFQARDKNAKKNAAAPQV
ncbi:MAG: hypothetical protein HYU37_18545 [Acidobacteria bacterium]|nr:hypothetical protein [Acidobacteriota bacterium]